MARLAFILVVLAALAPPASADLGGGAEVVFPPDRLFISQNGGDFVVPKDPQTRDRYFNLAHCVCSAANTGMETQFEVEIKVAPVPTPPINRPGDMWIGANCSDDVTRPTNCTKFDTATLPDLDTIAVTPTRRDFRIADLVNPKDSGCPGADMGSGNLWVLVDTDANGTYDYNKNDEILYDTLPPPAPKNATADSGEAAVQVTWDVPTERAEDIQYYQALCARADTGAAAHEAPTNDPRYQTAHDLCGVNLSITLTAAGAVVDSPDAAVAAVPDAAVFDAAAGPDAAPPDAALPPDAMPTGLPAGLANIDPAFICGETSGTSSQIRIDGLENNVPYRIVVVAVDYYGNASGIYFQDELTPLPVTDFWEDLHDKGSKVEGGFCLIAETYGDGGPLTSALRRFRDETLAGTAFGRWLTKVYYDVSGAIAPIIHRSIIARVIAAIVLAPLAVIALLWHVLTLPGLIALLFAVRWLRRRRKRGRGVPQRLVLAATLVALLALVSTASAQSSHDPYWSDPTLSQDVGDELADPHWHVGIKVGPYVPEIDAQLGMSPGPYEQMFGKRQGIMPVLDVDWLFLHRFGQLGVGGSIGFLAKKAHAYEANSDPNDPMRPRSDGDNTTFRLLPITATVVYRFDYLDERYGIPVVPYLRGGLAYYIWWIGAPSGSTAVIYPGDCDPKADGCHGNRARGASLGVSGSIGLAIRAERIDASAARSMREGGVEHAGFYAELSLAKVNGFGNDKKLSVGDKTWFAGVDFEF